MLNKGPTVCTVFHLASISWNASSTQKIQSDYCEPRFGTKDSTIICVCQNSLRKQAFQFIYIYIRETNMFIRKTLRFKKLFFVWQRNYIYIYNYSVIHVQQLSFSNKLKKITECCWLCCIYTYIFYKIQKKTFVPRRCPQSPMMLINVLMWNVYIYICLNKSMHIYNHCSSCYICIYIYLPWENERQATDP